MHDDAAAAEEIEATPTIVISPENLAVARAYGIVPDIHETDFIYWFVNRRWGGDHERAVRNYYDLGVYSARLVNDILTEVARVKAATGTPWTPTRMLDFASGYGNTARHLPNVMPSYQSGACDIHEAAVRFISEKLGLRSHLSSTVPERLDLPEQDVIFALSFFSHMPNASYSRWIGALARHLAPGGVLIFTANGHVTDITGGTPGTKAGPNGFGFTAMSEQRDLDGSDYGLTLSYPKWVFYTLQQHPELRLSRFQEGFWWARQDLYVCIREEKA